MPESKPRPRPEWRTVSEYEKLWKKIEDKDEEAYFKSWSPEIRKSYLEQGAEFVVDIHEKKPDTIVFLDKSARPLAGFLRAIWRRLYKEESSPEMRFMVGFTNYEDFYGYNPEADREMKEKVASAFRASSKDFNGRTVLIVDEVVARGATLTSARHLLKAAFPEIRSVIYGAFSLAEASEVASSDVAIGPPAGSAYSDATRRVLGREMYGESGKEVEEVSDEVLTRAARKTPATETWSYRLRQIGKHEMLDAPSLRGLDERKDEDAARLGRIRAAYEKLLPKE